MKNLKIKWKFGRKLIKSKLGSLKIWNEFNFSEKVKWSLNQYTHEKVIVGYFSLI